MSLFGVMFLVISSTCEWGILVSATPGLDPVSRPNYGVSFHPMKTLYPASSSWTHVFRIEIPNEIRLQMFGGKEKCLKVFCSTSETLENHFKKFRNAMVEDLNQVRESILDLTSRNSTTSNRRTKRNTDKVIRWSHLYNNRFSQYVKEYQLCLILGSFREAAGKAFNYQPLHECSRKAAIAVCGQLNIDCIKEYTLRCPDRSCSRLLEDPRAEATFASLIGHGSRRDRRDIQEENSNHATGPSREAEIGSNTNDNSPRDNQIAIIGELIRMQDQWAVSASDSTYKMKEIGEIIKVHVPDMSKRRTKRWNPFAWLGKHLFGLATNADMDRMIKVVQFVSEQQQTMSSRFTKYQRETASFMDVVSQRFTNVAGTISALHTEIQEQLRTLSGEIDDRLWKVMQHNVQTSVVLVDMIEKVQSLSPMIDHMMAAVNNLVQGKLSPYLVNQTILAQTINSLQNKIAYDYPYFHLTELNPQYYYKFGRINYFRSGEQYLLVTLDFPMSAMTKEFSLYSVSIHNTPITDVATQTSRLKTDVEYFGVTDDNSRYIEMSHKALSRCEDTTAFRCTSMLKIFDMEKPSCMAAIFNDHPSRVKTLCAFRFEKMEPIVDLVDVGNGKIMVHNADSVRQQCGQELLKERPGCVYCQIGLECGCSIHVSNEISAAAFPPRINNCIDSDGEYTVVHPINLAAVSMIYDLSNIRTVSGDTLYKERWLPKLPEIQVSEDFAVNINRDYDYSMKLDTVMKQAKAGLDVDPIKQIASSTWYFDSAGDFFTLSNVLGLFSLLTAIGSMALALYTRRAYRLLEQTVKTYSLVGMLQAPSAEALEDVPKDMLKYMMGYTIKTTTIGEGVPRFDDVITDLGNSPGCWNASHLVVLGVLSFIVILGFLVLTGWGSYCLYMNRFRSRCKLYLELGNLVESHDVLLMKLPGAMSHYHLMGMGLPGPYQIKKNKIWSYLTVTWHGMIIGNRMGNAPFKPPTSFRLYPWDTLKIQRIFRGRFTTTFKIEMGYKYYIIPRVCQLDCNGWSCKGVYNPEPTPAMLYPGLNTIPQHSLVTENASLAANTSTVDTRGLKLDITDGTVEYVEKPEEKALHQVPS